MHKVAPESCFDTAYYRKIKRRLLRQTNDCGICGKAITLMKEATIDHIIPLSRGGGDRISNLRLAHGSCNSLRGNKLDGEK